MATPGERTPLVAASASAPGAARQDSARGNFAVDPTHLAAAASSNTRRARLLLFLEARTPLGRYYETFTIALILLSVVTFVLASVAVPEYNAASPLSSWCNGTVCDALWFGNRSDNALAFLNLGPTSAAEILVVAVFSVDYLLRFATADLLDPKYAGVAGRAKFTVTFFSLVDLASTVPFYVDAFLLPNSDLAASTFLRMFRLLRMMRTEGRYDLALGMITAVADAQREVLGTALFILLTVWGVVRVPASYAEEVGAGESAGWRAEPDGSSAVGDGQGRGCSGS